jgi:predicted transcriptional regulator
VKRLPVIEDDGTLVGIVHRADVLRHLEAEREAPAFV